MRALLILFLFVSPIFAANLTSFYLNIPQFIYTSPSGSGMINDLQINFGKSNSEPLKLEITKEQNSFHGSFGPITANLSDPSKFLLDLVILRIKGLEARFDQASSFQLNNGFLSHPSLKDTAEVNKLSLLCTGKILESKNFWQKIFSQCTDKGKITIEKINFPLMTKIIQESSENTRDEGDEDMSQIAEDFELDLEKGEFTLGLKSEVYINVRLKATGQIIDDRTKNEIRITVNEVKVGFVVITDQVMRALKNNIQGENFKVVDNVIHIGYRK